ARRRTLLLAKGASVRGHEFHWSALDAPPAPAEAAYQVASADGYPMGLDGFPGGPRANVLASYVHLHFGADRRLAPAFVAAASGVAEKRAGANGAAVTWRTARSRGERVPDQNRSAVATGGSGTSLLPGRRRGARRS